MEATTTRLDAYCNLLSDMDWLHEFSDDADVSRRGRERLARLREMQPAVDPEGVLWDQALHNAKVHNAFAVPRPRTYALEESAERVVDISRELFKRAEALNRAIAEGDRYRAQCMKELRESGDALDEAFAIFGRARA